MASGGSHLPAFEEILKRGAASEPRMATGSTKKLNGEQSDMSLKTAVESAQAEKLKKENLVRRGLLSATEPRGKKNNKKKRLLDEDAGFSSESSPGQSRKRTPMTMPRTKITPSTPLEQRVALNRLKQRLFDDAADKEQDNKKENGIVNEEAPPRGENGSKKSSNLKADTISLSSIASDFNSDTSEMIDTDKIKERLNQVREYLRQATSMYVNLSMSEADEPSRSEQLSKLAKLIQQLRIQEQGYIDLLQRTLCIDDKESVADAASVASLEQQVASMGQQASSSASVADQKNTLAAQRQEIEQLREQRALLQKIVSQEKQLQELKQRQSSLLQMQKDAEDMIELSRNGQTQASDNILNNQRQQPPVERKPSNLSEANILSATQNNQRLTNEQDNEDMALSQADASQKRLVLENRLLMLQEKKQQMDSLLGTLKALTESQKREAALDIGQSATEFVSNSRDNEVSAEAATGDIQGKLQKLNDVRGRLQELRGIVADYETEAPPNTSSANNNESRDNRVTAQALHQKEGNTVSGAGGARLRFPDGSSHPLTRNELRALQNELENMLDNRNRPMPPADQSRTQIDMMRNQHTTTAASKKKTNAKKSNQSLPKKDINQEIQKKVKELQKARERLAKEEQHYSDTTSQTTATSQTGDETSDTESESSSVMQWQEDPEFQAKVRKLQMAKEKLHHLQELVNIVQQGGGPQLPIDDLADLALSLDESVDQYGESEEEGDEEEDEDDEEDDEEEEESEEEEEDEREDQSQATATSGPSCAYGDNYSNNERLYEEMVKKQRQELDSLLKEREQLLEAQRKLAVLSGPTSVNTHTQTPPKSAEKNTQTSTFLPLTKEEVSKQNSKQRGSGKKSLANKFSNMSVEPQYGSEIEYQRNKEMERRRLDRMADDIIDRRRMSQIADNDSESAAAVPLRTNAMVVSEIRRQREMFEQKKKQKFVEKQQRKKAKKENHLDDQATYSVHSDIDEGVGVSMFSADVTTAATWGGSTEQSSSDSDDSAVYEEEDDDQDEDETAQGDNKSKEDDVPPLFNVKKYDDRPRRNISWLGDEIPGKKRKLDKKRDNYRGAGSVSWSLDASPPRSRDHPRQGNLTPAYKLMQDRERSRQQIESHLSTDAAPSEQLHSQLVSMCTSLLRNEQTLLAMLQSQNTSRSFQDGASNRQPLQLSSDNVASRNIREFFQHTETNDTYKQTLRGLQMCYDRVEGHQRDLRYLQRQFNDMNIASAAPEDEAPADSSMWVEPPSLHFSNFGATSITETSSSRADGSPGKKRRKVKKSKYDTDIPSCLKSGLTIPDSKETQTENSLFNNHFISQNQTYSLFGNTSLEGGLSPSAHGKDGAYGFNEQQGSPGAIGQKLDSSPHDFDPEPVDDYYARVSEYNPLSYADNFPSTRPANVVTTSYLSMEKERSNTMTSEQNKEKTIWPSFFKQTDVGVKDESDASSVKPNMGDKLDTGADSGSNYSLFEALRDSIYSEVATLISMNESRPHYLIELFRELQLLTSDYLRQRALYALQDVVTRFLTDENLGVSPQKPAHFQQEKFINTSSQSQSMPYQEWITTASEQTPSESVLTTDDEDEASALQALARQIHNNEVYDYAELADSQSEENISTPSAQDHPFASEDLGSTVINLDEALEKMRTYERNMAEAKRAFEAISMDVRNSTPASVAAEVKRKQKAAYEAVKQRMRSNEDTVSNSSAGDMASETSSEMLQPSIDTQKLDKQIKAVMRDLIPFLNDNMDTSCTDTFLAQVKDKIVELAKLKEPDSERESFGRFFHKQLETILQDALLKYCGRKLKECGEDVLIEVSEILFNELAFFKLMQDLERPLYYGGSAAPYLGKDSNYNSVSEDEDGRVPQLNLQDCDDASSVADSDLDDQINSALAKDVVKMCMDGDDEDTAEEDTVRLGDDAEAARKSVNLELSVSESKAVNCSGSGEDDDDEGDAPAVSVANGLQSVAQQATVHSAIGQGMNQAAENEAGREQQQIEDANEVEHEDEREEGNQVLQPEPEDERLADAVVLAEAERDDDQPEQDQPQQDQPEQDQVEQDRVEQDQVGQDEAGQVENAGQVQVEDENAEDERNAHEAPLGEQGAVAVGAVGGDEVNGMDEEVENEETEETRDSRPTKLEEYTEADFQAHMASDENAANAVLAHINEVHRQELAGDPNVLPEPGQAAPMNGIL